MLMLRSGPAQTENQFSPQLHSHAYYLRRTPESMGEIDGDLCGYLFGRCRLAITAKALAV